MNTKDLIKSFVTGGALGFLGYALGAVVNTVSGAITPAIGFGIGFTVGVSMILVDKF